jgi:CRP/FNR family transcriptional regulator, cyclic AMP receptor protein
MLQMPATKPPSVTELLKQVPIFSDLSEQELTFLAARVGQRKFGEGELIFSEGEPCSGMFVVESGNVRIFKSSTGGREQVLSIDGPGGSVAELPVFDGGNYPASAQAITATALLFVSKQDFHTLCLQHPEVALKVLRIVGGRLRRLVGIIEELSFTTVRHRLAAVLVRLAKLERKPGSNESTFTLPVNNNELAAQIGTVRELVSRNLSRLQSEGLIEMDGRKIIVSDLKRLESEVRESN